VIARRGELRCVEVKSQRARLERADARASQACNSPIWRPRDRFLETSRARQRRAARFVLDSLALRRAAARVDLAEVWIDTATGEARIEVHRDRS
jgi:hypothetical protein